MNGKQTPAPKVPPVISPPYLRCGLVGALFGVYCMIWLGVNHPADSFSDAAFRVPGWGLTDTVGASTVLELQVRAVALRTANVALEYGYQFVMIPAAFALLLAALMKAAARNLFFRFLAVFLWTFVALSFCAGVYGFVAGLFFDERYAFLAASPTVAQRVFSALRDSGVAIYGFNLVGIIPLCALVAALLSLFIRRKQRTESTTVQNDSLAHQIDSAQTKAEHSNPETSDEESFILHIKEREHS